MTRAEIADLTAIALCVAAFGWRIVTNDAVLWPATLMVLVAFLLTSWAARQPYD